MPVRVPLHLLSRGEGTLSYLVALAPAIEAVFVDVLLDGWWDAIADRAALGDSLPDVRGADVQHRAADGLDPVVCHGELTFDLGGRDVDTVRSGHGDYGTHVEESLRLVPATEVAY